MDTLDQSMPPPDEEARATEDQQFCQLGDRVVFYRGVSNDGRLVIEAGAVYHAVQLVGWGWDLERISGEGPDEVRLLNSEMPDFVRVVND